MILGGHTINETSEQVVEITDGDVNVLLSDAANNLCWGIAQDEHSCVGEVPTGLEVVLSLDIGLVGADLSLDLSPAEEGADSHGLTKDFWVSEDLGPRLKFLQITMHVGARLDVFLEMEDELLKIHESLDQVHLLEILEELAHILKQLR